MSEENKQGSASDNNAGSPNSFASGPAGAGSAGEPNKSANFIPKTQYEELEIKLGKQGSELGNVKEKLEEAEKKLEDFDSYKSFFENNSDWLLKLDQNPDLVEAIRKNDIDPKLIRSVLEGKVSIEGAEIVTQANKDIKKELGKEIYNDKSIEEINKMIEKKAEEKIKEISEKIEKKFQEEKEIEKFEKNLANFIQNTPKEDLDKYSKEIYQWLEEHNSEDIIAAYKAVKGEKIIEEKKKEEEEKAKEEAKKVAMNAGGGTGKQTSTVKASGYFKELIKGTSDPNSFI